MNHLKCCVIQLTCQYMSSNMDLGRFDRSLNGSLYKTDFFNVSCEVGLSNVHKKSIFVANIVYSFTGQSPKIFGSPILKLQSTMSESNKINNIFFLKIFPHLG